MRLVRAVGSIGLAALLTACSASESTYSPRAARSAGVRHASSISFAFQTVDDPSSNVNAVNAINGAGAIAGTVGDGSPSDPYTGYTSQPPYTGFDAVLYSGAAGTVATALSNAASSPVLAGYVIHPPQLPGIWAGVRINGIWSIFRDRKGGKGSATATEILGINNTGFAVGFYKSTSGIDMPVVVNVPLERFTALKPPGAAGAQATGINDVNDVAGWESTSTNVIGFFERARHYYALHYPNAAATQPLSLNNQDQLVGSYQDSSGVTHGFLMSNPKGSPSQQFWQTIDAPGAAYGTHVTGISDNDDICGYYVDSAHVQHGFVATPSS